MSVISGSNWSRPEVGVVVAPETAAAIEEE